MRRREGMRGEEGYRREGRRDEEGGGMRREEGCRR